MSLRYILPALAVAGLAVTAQPAATQPAGAFSLKDEQAMALTSLGRTAALGLHCKFHEEVVVIKERLPDLVPKVEQVRKPYEEATSESYATYAAAEAPCPERAAYQAKVERRLDLVGSVFGR